MPSLDISTDFEVLDFFEGLTLRVTGIADQTIARALNEPVGWKEAEASNGMVREGDVVWVWQTTETPTRPPLGSKLIDGDGVSWTILSLVHNQHTATWAATCRNLAVEYSLDNLISVLKATYVKSSAGEAVPVWATIASGIAARIQPTAQNVEVRQDADWTADEHRVVCESLPHLALAGADYRVVDAQGCHYRILGYEQAERIDELPVLTVLRIYEGAEGQEGSSSSGW